MFLNLFTPCSQYEQGCAKYFEDKNPIRAPYNYEINGNLQINSSCLY